MDIMELQYSYANSVISMCIIAATCEHYGSLLFFLLLFFVDRHVS